MSAMTAPVNWRDAAACLDADPDLFFPISGARSALRQIDEAKRICRTCPAQTQCLAWALDNGVTDGVWGGTTEDERRAIRSLPRMSGSREEDDGESYQPAARGDRRIRAQAAQGKATRILSDARPGDKRARTHPCGGFAGDFATADGEKVWVEAFTWQQFADLAKATRLAGTFAFLERVLDVDFSARGDLHAHRVTIAVLLASWFARHTVAELAAALAGTSVPWAHLHNLTGSALHADRGFAT